MADAKCAQKEAYFCTKAVFEKSLPDMSLENYGKDFCFGSINLGKKSMPVVFLDKMPCPLPGDSIVGHYGYLCQDTGDWSKADHWYSRKSEFCAKSYDESLKQAQATATLIKVGMSRTQVREEVKDYVYLNGGQEEQYYLFPDIVLKVSFDEPHGAYSMENKVIAPVIIKRQVLPQPNKAAVVLKLQVPNTNELPKLKIALSFTVSDQPVYEGVRIVEENIPKTGEKTLFGFRNGDGVAHIKLPTESVKIENENFSYVRSGNDRQENGMFSLYPQRSDPPSYLLKGVFYAQGHVFVVDESIYSDEEKVLYSLDD